MSNNYYKNNILEKVPFLNQKAMVKKQFQTTQSNKKLFYILVVAAIITLLALVAMQFTDEVKWTSFDFIIATILLFGTGLTLEFLLRKVKKIEYRIIIFIALFIVLLLTWIELAVGMFDSPFAGS